MRFPRLQRLYLTVVYAIPHVFVVGPDGKIAYQAKGFAPDLEERLSEVVERLLAKD